MKHMLEVLCPGRFRSSTALQLQHSNSGTGVAKPGSTMD